MTHFTLFRSPRILITFLAFVISTGAFSQNSPSADCNTVNPACTGTSAYTTGSGVTQDFVYGSGSNPTTNPAGYNSGCLLSGELNPMFFLITASSNGTLEWTFGNTSGSTGCQDWIMWPYTASTCGQIAAGTLPPVACNWNGNCSGLTGMATPLPAGAAAGDFQGELNVTCGQQFLLCISNYSYQSGTAALTFIGTATVSCNPPPPGGLAVTVNNATICAGQSTTLTASGATTYSWSPPTGLSSTTGSSVTANPSTTTTYTVTGTNGCNTGTATSTVTVNPVPNVTASATAGGFNNTATSTTICQGGSATLTAAGANTYTWSPATGLSSTTGTSVTASPATTTTYTITGTGPGGCTDTYTFTVIVNPIPTVTVPNATICAGQSATLTSTVNPTGGTYSWSPGGQTSSSITVSPAATTTYTLTYTLNGCSNSDPGTVIVNPVPTVTVNSATICAGQSATLTATPSIPGGTFSWSPGGQTTASISVSPGSTTTYTVTYNLNGCTNTGSGTVTVNPVPTVTVNSQTICAGQSATLTATPSIPGGTFSWSPGGQTTSSITVSPGSTTTYTVTYSLNGCTNTGTGTVTVNPVPTVTVNSTTVCVGQSGTLTATPSIPGGTYSWSPGGQTTQSITVAPGSTTTYTVTYSLSGCTNTGSGTITVNPVPTVTVNSQTVCAGQSATLTATPSIPGGTFSWSPGGQTTTSITVTPGSTTTYTVTYSLNGCTNTGSGTVTVNPAPTVTVNSATVCAGTSATLTATPSIPGGTYSWAPGGQTTQSITVTPGSTTTYTVTYSLSGCTNTGTGTVTVNPIPNVTVNSITICPGASGTITATPDIPGGTYSWSPGGQSTQSITVTPASTITYTVTYTVNGCTNTGSGTITVGGTPSVAVNSATICVGQSATITATPGTPGGTYSWAPGGQTTQSITVSPATTTTYTVTYDLGGCIGTGTGTVTVNALPTVTVTNATVCAGTSATLNSTVNPTGGTYSWSPGGQTTANITDAPAATTTYTLTYTDPNGCVNSGTGTITVNPVPTVTVNSTTICPGNSATLTATPSIPGGTFSWSPGGQTTASITVTPGSTTTYTVTYTLNGCTNTGSGTVTVNATPSVAVNSATICVGQNATLTATAGTGTGTYSWAPGGQTTQAVTVSPATTTTYTVTYTENGCVGTGSGTVTVNALPTVTVGNDVVCAGSTGTLTSTVNPTGGTYSWSPTSQTGATLTDAPAATTSYTLTYTDPNGCINSGTGTITVNPIPNVTVNSVTICPGNSATLTATPDITGGTFSWSPGGQTTASITVSPASTTTYTVTYTLNGCTNTGSGTVTVNATPSVAINNATICVGQNATLTATAGTGAGTYSWAPGGQTSQAITVSPATTTTYTCTYTENGCVGTGTGTVTVNALPTVTVGTDVVCAGTNGTLTSTVNPTGGTYSWSPTSQTGATLTDAPATTTTYTLTYTDPNGCVNSGTGTITINPVPTVTVNSVSICAGSSGTITAAPSIPGGTFSWTPGGQTTASITDAPATTSSYSVTYDLNGCTATGTGSISVISNPVADFTTSPVCEGTATQFTDQSTAGVISWTYDFGDGSPTSALQNPTHTYGAAGTYNVTLTVSAGSCGGTVTLPVVVNPNPVAAFTGTPACPGSNTTFADNSTVSSGTIQQWDWTFTSGTPATANTQNPSTVYATGGTYSVGLTVTSDQGCTNTITQNITIPFTPVADFTATTVCEGFATNFTDQSTVTASTITAWSWDMGDGSTDNVQNPTYTYATAGTYNVTLTVTSADGCVSSPVVIPVNVISNPVADFSTTPVCEGTATQFTDLSTAGVTGWTYDFGDGSPTSASQNPTHTYGAAGTYNVTLTVTAGTCSGTVTLPVVVNPNPVAAFTGTPACPGSNTTFADNSTVSSGTIQQWDWTFTSGTPATANTQNPSTVYATGGTYSVGLTVTSDQGCTNTITQNITIPFTPVADFTATTVCEGFATNFTDQSTVTASTITAWSWDMGDGSTDNVQNPTYTYATAGTYNVTLTVTSADGCVSSPVVIPVTVMSNPIADFTSSSVCEGLVTQFTDQSTAGVTTWTYDFGDGSPTSASQNPTHTYGAAGTYNTTLTVSVNGCVGTTTLPVTVHPIPQPAFTITSACPGSNASVTDGSTVATGTIASYNWTMTNATPATSTAQNPTFTYAGGGTYSITLDITSDQGCTNTLTQSVNIPYMPVPDFSFTQVCEGNVSDFTDLSTVTGGTITGWNWDMGDGTAAQTVQNPAYTYGAPGTYNVTLTPTTNDGCSGPSVTYQVDVYAAPVANFTVADACQINAIVPANSSTGASTYSWNFGDGSALDPAQNPFHTYGSAGAYNITLIVGTINGCADTLTQPVNVFPMPTAAFSTGNVCDGMAVTFTDQTNANGGTIATWTWNFGDASGSSQQSPSHLYGGMGNYNVTLDVVTTDGCAGTITQQVTVYPLPTISFTATTVCEGTATQFTNQSTVTPGALTGFNWDYGDGNGSTQFGPSYTYGAAGTYNVMLIGTTDFGCSDTLIQPVTVNANPVVDFTSDITASCTPLCVNFTDNSSVAGAAISSWNWDLGDGSQMGVQNPSHCYTNNTFNTDYYDITLTVTSNLGCTSTLTMNNMLEVYPMPIADFTFSPETTTILEPEITFVNLSQGADFYDWDFGDGQGNSTLSDPIYTYQNIGTYTVTLVVSTTHGCIDTVQHDVTIDPELLLYVPNAFTPDGDGVNDIFLPVVQGLDPDNYELLIFNRWGELIFQTDQVSKGWDGTHRGQKAKEDVYVWKIKAFDVATGERNEYVGHVNLLR